MSLAYPLVLILILVLPFLWWQGWPRQRFRRLRDFSSLILRSLILLCLILALAGAQIVQGVERQALVFLVDASDSISPAGRAAQEAWLRDAIAEKGAEDIWSVLVFGADVVPDRAFNTATELPDIQSRVQGNQSNLAEAIQTAIAIFPADARRRIVILSDGAETLGSAQARAELAAASGIEISYVPVLREALDDVRIIDLQAPARVAEGQEFDLSVSIEASRATAATLFVFSNGRLIEEAALDLQAGITRYGLTQRIDTGGFLNFSARLVVPDDADAYSQNNELAAFTQIIGPPRVLLLSQDAEEIAQLLPALEGIGVQVDVRLPSQLPPETAALSDYRSIIIANVPASAFSRQQMTRIDSYVRELGGGLIFIGGPQSYGPGFYLQTPLEETLPVEMDLRDQQRMPQLTIAYLIDRSGSMAALDPNGVPNIELAKRAIDLSLDYLTPSDRVGIGTFDSGGAWVAEIQPVQDQRLLQQLVATLRAGGGTDIGAGLNLVERDIINEESPRKHIILMTDGGASSRGLVEQVRRLNTQFGVTTSVIALGALVPPFLREMAEVGQGNFHNITDASEIPNIFAIETVLASRTFIEEGDFSLVQTANNPILEGISALPNLRGYVATTPKASAQVILRGPEPFSDPILVIWQRGLGRAIAFTSDATSRWAADWVTWSDFARFWGQTLSYSITESASNNIEARITMRDGLARLIVDAQEDDGRFLNNLQLEASLLGPDNEGRSLSLQQVAPGRYEAEFVPETEGAYFAAVRGSGLIAGEAVQFNEINGWVMSYSPEYAQPEPNTELLEQLAEITGGRSLADDAAATFTPGQEIRLASTPIWPLLLIIAMLLLPFDIAVRRLIITPSDLRRLRAWAFPSRAQNLAPDSRLSSLRDARERARQRSGSDDRPGPSRPAPDQPAPPAPSAAPQQPSSPPDKLGSPPGDSTVSALLKRRRRDSED